MKLTQWCNAAINPVHTGWYECKGPSLSPDATGKVFRRWNGHNWEWIATIPFKANGDKPPITAGELVPALMSNSCKWRGVEPY